MDIQNFFSKNISRHQEFFSNNKADTLFFANSRNLQNLMQEFEKQGIKMPVQPYEDELSVEYIKNHAFDLGKYAMEEGRSVAAMHSILEDDYHPFAKNNWGTGVKAAYISGSTEVLFSHGTSYTLTPVIHDIRNVDKIKFNADNFWTESLINFWRGAEQEWNGESIGVGLYFRSPLDTANDLRGNDLFYDLYDYPEELKKFIQKVTDTMIDIIKMVRTECRILRDAPGGILGMVTQDPAIFLNGDPVDLIKPDFIDEFSNQYVEKMAEEIGAILFHHHSIGYKKAPLIASTKNLWMQQMSQDPNGPIFNQLKDEDWLPLSQATLDGTPILLEQFNLFESKLPIESMLNYFKNGRFILPIGGQTISELQHRIYQCRNYIEKMR